MPDGFAHYLLVLKLKTVIGKLFNMPVILFFSGVGEQDSAVDKTVNAVI